MSRPRKNALRVYLDANVAINWVQEEPLALGVLERVHELRALLLSSDFLRLEVEPRHGLGAEPLRRLRTRMFFGAAKKTLAPSRAVLERAIRLRQDEAIGAMDALHLATAELNGADVFVTAESRRKPMHHVRLHGTQVLTPRAFLDETR